jgi:hypothetical protein
MQQNDNLPTAELRAFRRALLPRAWPLPRPQAWQAASRAEGGEQSGVAGEQGALADARPR